MTKKKENKFLEFLLTYGWAFLVIIIMVGVLAYLGIIKNPIDYYCSRSSDKCVCEEYKFKYEPFDEWSIPMDNINIGKCSGYKQDDFLCTDAESFREFVKENNLSFEEKCTKFRKKSQTELDIDDCQNNPREDEKCKCQEYSYGDNYNNIIFLKVVNNSYVAFFPEFNRYIIIDDLTIDECNFGKDDCIKSHPKTDWEKHPEDYVAEIKCAEYSDAWDKEGIVEFCGNNESLINLDFCPPLKDNKLLAKFRIEHCIKNQTTYRLKNECEKIYEGSILRFTKDYPPFEMGNEVKVFKKLVGQDTIFVVKQPNGNDRNIYDSGFQESIIIIKGNPDWIEEQNISKEDLEWLNNSIWWYCDFSPIFNKEYNSTQEEINFDIERCDYYKDELKRLNQTICREKTDVEKLMDKNCDELRYWIYEARCLFPVFSGHGCGYTKRDKELRENYNKAFIKKGCEEQGFVWHG